MIQIDACKKGDKEALGKLYSVYAHKLRGVCRHYIKNESIAEDILHDAFVIIFTSLKTLKDNSKLEGWMATIVKNLSLKYLESSEKGEIHLSQLDIEVGEETPNEAHKEIELEVLLAAIEQLPQGNKEVFKLYVLEGLSHKEIGAMLGIAPHSSSSQLFRAKKMLRTMLTEYRGLLLLPFFIPYLYFLSREKYHKKTESHTAIVKSRKTLPHTPPVLRKERSDRGETTSMPSRRYDHHIAQRQTATVSTTTDTASTTQAPRLESFAMIFHADSLQRHLETADKIADASRLPQISAERFMAFDAHASLNIGRRRYPWTLNAGYSSNANANGGVAKLDYLSVIDYANGGAMTKLYTWNDYFNYMNRNEALMDSVERAKMYQITLNQPMDGNSLPGEGEVARHHRPRTFGISLNKQLNPNWTFGTGCTYTRLTSEFESQYHQTTLKKTQKIDYIGIPLRLTYRIRNNRRFQVYTTGGVTLDIPIRGSLDQQFVVTADSTFTLKSHLQPRHQWSATLGIGMQYKIFNPFSLYFEPNVSYYFKDGSGIETYRTEHPFLIAVPFGLRITW